MFIVRSAGTRHQVNRKSIYGRSEQLGMDAVGYQNTIRLSTNNGCLSKLRGWMRRLEIRTTDAPGSYADAYGSWMLQVTAPMNEMLRIS
ncbi:MAG: hypothetical protein JXR70_14685 [Spirochaetales bacterium]|nr:hypothetical protein [Bacteroidales bacterium]MBN2738228.1 hypothetical protein [Spirochaetales bacterium]